MADEKEKPKVTAKEEAKPKVMKTDEKPKKAEEKPKKAPVKKADDKKPAAKKAPAAKAASAPKPAVKKTPKPKKKRAKKSERGVDIGIDVRLPTKTCNDRDCPFHGTLAVRGHIIDGVVTSDRMMNTVVVKRDYMRLNKKYERLEKRSSKYSAHSPSCLDVKQGDNVRIMECRPLSKTVAYVVIENRS